MPILILRRLLILIPILIGISLLSFVLVSLSPSDPAEVSIRVNAMVPTPELIALTRHELGLDLPFWQRYFQWCGAVLHGDWNWDVGAEFRISIKKPGLQGLRP